MDFATMAISHDRFTMPFGISASRPATSVRLHQEWALISQLWWDTILGQKMRNDKFRCLTTYVDELFAAAQEHCRSHTIPPTWSTWPCISSMYNHPFLPFLLQLPVASWNTEYGWKELYSLPKHLLPDYMVSITTPAPTPHAASDNNTSDPTKDSADKQESTAIHTPLANQPAVNLE